MGRPGGRQGLTGCSQAAPTRQVRRAERGRQRLEGVLRGPGQVRRPDGRRDLLTCGRETSVEGYDSSVSDDAHNGFFTRSTPRRRRSMCRWEKKRVTAGRQGHRPTSQAALIGRSVEPSDAALPEGPAGRRSTPRSPSVAEEPVEGWRPSRLRRRAQRFHRTNTSTAVDAGWLRTSRPGVADRRHCPLLASRRRRFAGPLSR